MSSGICPIRWLYSFHGVLWSKVFGREITVFSVLLAQQSPWAHPIAGFLSLGEYFAARMIHLLACNSYQFLPAHAWKWRSRGSVQAGRGWADIEAGQVSAKCIRMLSCQHPLIISSREALSKRAWGECPFQPARFAQAILKGKTAKGIRSHQMFVVERYICTRFAIGITQAHPPVQKLRYA